MPSASVEGGTRHSRTRGHAGMLPITSARPVSRTGGTCASETPSAASVAHNAIAPRAYRLACMGAASAASGHAGGVRLFVGVVAGAHHRADRRVREAHLLGLRLEHPERV